MYQTTLLPDPALVRLDYTTTEADTLIVVLSARRTTVPCPDCQRPATRVHSRYRRRLAEETQRARDEPEASVRHVHKTMAQLYRVRLDAEERGAERGPVDALRNGKSPALPMH